MPAMDLCLRLLSHAARAMSWEPIHVVRKTGEIPGMEIGPLCPCTWEQASSESILCLFLFFCPIFKTFRSTRAARYPLSFSLISKEEQKGYERQKIAHSHSHSTPTSYFPVPASCVLLSPQNITMTSLTAIQKRTAGTHALNHDTLSTAR